MSGFRDFEQTLFSRIIGLSVAVLVTVSLSAPLLAQEGMRKSPDGDGWISINKPHRYADVFLDSDRFTGAYTLTPQVADIGRTAKLVVVAHVNDRWYSHDGAAWQLWNSARMADLRTFAGDYTIFAGYQVGDGPLVYNDKPLQFSVQSKNSDALLSFKSDVSMEAYLKEGLQNGASRQDMFYDMVVTSVAGPTARTTGSTSDSNSSGSRTSTTNLQEAGVDEADSIKVDGSTLYMLSSCDEKVCLQAHTLDTSAARASQLSTFKLRNTVAPDGMFLVEKGVQG